MSINGKVDPNHRTRSYSDKKIPSHSVFSQSTPVYDRTAKIINHASTPITTSKKSLKNKEKEDIGTRMFGFIEANLVEEEVEEGLYNTKISFTRDDESTEILQEKLILGGVD